MAKLLTTLKQEVEDVIPPTIFFFIAFMLLMATHRLIQREYGLPLAGFGMAIIGALLVGKVVLVVDHLPFVNKFPHKPLIYNVVWKTLIYLVAAILVRYGEHVIPLLLNHQSLGEAHRHLLEQIIWPHVILVQMWLSVLFFVYCALRELVRAIGREKVIEMFIGGRHPGKT